LRRVEPWLWSCGVSNISLLEAVLGQLVRLDIRGRRPARPDPDKRPETAQIVLFTGVRYERGGPDAPDKPLGTTAGTKRRRG
jgi:hypothetical protein